MKKTATPYGKLPTVIVSFTFTKRIRDEAPLIPDKVRAGDLVRESPPVEEYNNLKRDVTKAKFSSPYLKNALQNPNFDLNKVYVLSTTEE